MEKAMAPTTAEERNSEGDPPTAECLDHRIEGSSPLLPPAGTGDDADHDGCQHAEPEDDQIEIQSA